MDAQPSEALFISVISIGEIAFGVSRLPDGARRRSLEIWREGLVLERGSRLLPVDVAITETWGLIRARAQIAKKSVAPIDALIAATAEVHDLVVVTRNVRDFEAWGGPVINPWPEPEKS